MVKDPVNINEKINKEIRHFSQNNKLELVNLFLINFCRVWILGYIIKSLIIKDYSQILVAIVTLILFFYPILLKLLFKFKLPLILEITTTIFIFCSQYLGSIEDIYGKLYWWDTFLHASSAVLICFLGFMVVYLLNKKYFNIKINPVLIILFVFCFTITMGVIWEFFEYTIDMTMGEDMQRTKNLAPEDSPMTDTMVDLMAAFVGSAIACTWGYQYIKKQDDIIFAKLFKNSL